MAWPYLWSQSYWRFIHCSILSFKDVYFTDEFLSLWLEFFSRLCRLLPCPNCTFHCKKHVQSTISQDLEKPFHDWQTLWDYAVDFHNNVSKRTSKVTYTSEEALETWQDFVKNKTREDMFIQDHWDMLHWCVNSYAADPNKVTTEEATYLKEFFRISLRLIPFRDQPVEDRLAEDVLLEVLNSEQADFSTRDQATMTLSHLFNSVCGAFGLPKRTKEEMEKFFYDKYAGEKYLTYVRTVQIHEEDQKKLLEMQKKLNDIESGAVNMSKEECGGVNENWRTASMILGILWGTMLLLLMLAYLYVYRFKKGRVKFEFDYSKKDEPMSSSSSSPKVFLRPKEQHHGHQQTNQNQRHPSRAYDQIQNLNTFLPRQGAMC